MAGIPVAFGDVLHQYGNGAAALHRRIIAKRQGREPIESTPGGPASSTDEGSSLSLGRPSTTPTTGGDDGGDDEDTSSTTPTSEREFLRTLYSPYSPLFAHVREMEERAKQRVAGRLSLEDSFYAMLSTRCSSHYKQY